MSSGMKSVYGSAQLLGMASRVNSMALGSISSSASVETRFG
jgi:hypothetical protein